MAVVLTENFESGLAAYTLVGTPTTGALGARTGSAGLIIDTLAAAAIQYIEKALVFGTRQHVERWYIKVDTRPNVTQTFLQINCTGGVLKLVLTSGGVLRLQIGAGTTVDTITLTTGQWYRLDLVADSSTGTRSLKLQIDGGTEYSTTAVVAAADQSLFRIGWAGSTTGRVFVDDLITGNALTDYPFGAPPTAGPGVATGTGAALDAVPRLAASAGVATGVSVTHVAVGNDLIVESTLASPSGVADTFDADAPAIATAIPTTTSGTGAAQSPAQSVAATGGIASGTGAAATASTSKILNVAGGMATGTGAALDATTVKILSLAAQLASGTGSAGTPTVRALAGSSLQVIMG